MNDVWRVKTTEKNSRTRKTPCRDIKGCAKKDNVKEVWEKEKKKQSTKPQTRSANCSVGGAVEKKRKYKHAKEWEQEH